MEDVSFMAWTCDRYRDCQVGGSTEYRFWFCYLHSAVLLDGTGSDVRGIWVRFWLRSFAGGEDAGFCFGAQLSRTMLCPAGHRSIPPIRTANFFRPA